MLVFFIARIENSLNKKNERFDKIFSIGPVEKENPFTHPYAIIDFFFIYRHFDYRRPCLQNAFYKICKP